jgi:hypothetical protein
MTPLEAVRQCDIAGAMLALAQTVALSQHAIVIDYSRTLRGWTPLIGCCDLKKGTHVT